MKSKSPPSECYTCWHVILIGCRLQGQDSLVPLGSADYLHFSRPDRTGSTISSGSSPRSQCQPPSKTVGTSLGWPLTAGSLAAQLPPCCQSRVRGSCHWFRAAGPGGQGVGQPRRWRRTMLPGAWRGGMTL